MTEEDWTKKRKEKKEKEKKTRRRKKREKLNERKGQNLDRKNPWQHAKHSRLKICITSCSRLRRKEAQFESSGISVHLDFCDSPQYPTVQLQLYNRSVERIFFSRVNFLSWLLFRYPFHPRVTAVARKRSKVQRWQVTAKYACTLHMWLCMKWHGAWLRGVHRTRRDGSSFMWHQPCQCCKYTASDFEKCAIKASHSRIITCERSESARERRIALYKSDQQQPTN